LQGSTDIMEKPDRTCVVCGKPGTLEHGRKAHVGRCDREYKRARRAEYHRREKRKGRQGSEADSPKAQEITDGLLTTHS